MTIEERIDKLTERHDALARSVELLLRDTVDLRRDYEERCLRTDQRIAQIMEAINGLAHIAEAHDNGLDSIQGE